MFALKYGMLPLTTYRTTSPPLLPTNTSIANQRGVEERSTDLTGYTTVLSAESERDEVQGDSQIIY